ncbi:MAG: hypothetical protein IIB54_06340 [Planctomycetes bacterium]|nr:hypothetical protein [Planctomycetota bacterium]
MKRTLLFVYNADSGMFNTLSDMAHKVFSPKTYSCNLCALTHSTFSMRDEWKEFIESLGVELEFLHRDEFRKIEGVSEEVLPVIFSKRDEKMEILADAASINACKTMDELKTLIRERLERIPSLGRRGDQPNPTP